MKICTVLIVALILSGVLTRKLSAHKNARMASNHEDDSDKEKC